jgi:hypothetical protein
MSTNDVPGHNPAHGDTLHAGCWAEHDDGSYVHVQSTEDDVVVFEVFDTTRTPVDSYRGTMSETQFKRQFSWDPKNPKSVKWVWHDRTPFSFKPIIAKGLQPGSRPAMATDLLAQADRVRSSADRLGIDLTPEADLISVAAQIAADLGLQATAVDGSRFSRALAKIRDGLQGAIDELRT